MENKIKNRRNRKNTSTSHLVIWGRFTFTL